MPPGTSELAAHLSQNSDLRILRPLLEKPEFSHLKEPDFFPREMGLIDSPLLLPGMEQAVLYLREALERRERILVLGDRDVDGVSSAALMGAFLEEAYGVNADPEAGAKIWIRVSDDGEDYGLSPGVLESILEFGADLIILLDMGTSNGPEIDRLIAGGGRVIVLDHHVPHIRVPDNPNCAFVNPMLAAESLDNGGKIATAGLVFKTLLAFALSHTLEWKTCHYVQAPLLEGGAQIEDAARTPPPDGAPKQGYVYRLGAFLGACSSPEEAQALAQSRFPGAGILEIKEIELENHPQFKMDAREQSLLARNPVLGGRFLFSRLLRSRPRLTEFARKHSDLAALGLVADLVPLLGENRAIVRLGIGQAGFEHRVGSRNYRPGLEALIKALGLRREKLLSRDLGWSLGPALNAAGRMGNTALALRLLLSRDESRAREDALSLVRLNQDRKDRVKRNEDILARLLEKNPELLQDPILFCYEETLEPGVSGIMAARLTETYERPAVYLNPDGAHARGSARTYNGCNVLELLKSVESLFKQYGGHAEAAGFSIEFEKIPALQEALREASRDMGAYRSVASEKAEREPKYDLELSPEALGFSLLDELELLEPFGPGNPEPVFKLAGVRVRTLRLLTDGKHAKFTLEEKPNGADFVAWGKGPWFSDLPPGSRLDLYGRMETNYFRGISKPQFRVEQARLAGG